MRWYVVFCCTLIAAARNGHVSTLRKLLKNGAALDAETPEGETARMVAMKYKLTEVAQILQKAENNKQLKLYAAQKKILESTFLGIKPKATFSLFKQTKVDTSPSLPKDLVNIIESYIFTPN